MKKNVTECGGGRLLIEFEGNPKEWMEPFRHKDEFNGAISVAAVLRLMDEVEENQK